jgi:GNAT superfamily N-acetyltransferase
MTPEEILAQAIVLDTHQSVSVSMKLDWGKDSYARLATASSDMFDMGVWWVTRVRVPDAHQGKGIGTVILGKLIEIVTAKPGFVSLSVVPGGYNADVRRQRRFYVRCGFSRRKEGVYVWTPTTNHGGG